MTQILWYYVHSDSDLVRIPDTLSPFKAIGYGAGAPQKKFLRPAGDAASSSDATGSGVASLRWKYLPSLKLTASWHLKMDGWNTFRFLLGRFRPIFEGAHC